MVWSDGDINNGVSYIQLFCAITHVMISNQYDELMLMLEST